MAQEPLPAPLPGPQFSAAVSALTSTFGDPTRREIYLFAREGDEGVTAAEVADRFRLHPNVARHHLDKLATAGYLEVRPARPAGGGAGRPSKRYRSTGKATNLELPSSRDDLLATLLGRALALLPREQAEALAEQVGEDHGRAIAARMAPGDGQRSRQAALEAVAGALTAVGFAAHTERRGRSLAIVSEACPFGVTSGHDAIVCAVDRGMVKGMLDALQGDGSGGVRPEVRASRASGDDVCVTVV